MEKLRFTIRFIILLAALPAIMFTELTRKEKVNAEPKQNTEKVSAVRTEAAMINYSPFMQAVYNW